MTDPLIETRKLKAEAQKKAAAARALEVEQKKVADAHAKMEQIHTTAGV